MQRSIKLTALIESSAGAAFAAAAGLGAISEIVRQVIGPDTAVSVDLVINVGLIFGAAYLLFHAGGTWKRWMGALEQASQDRNSLEKVQEDLAKAQKVVSDLAEENRELRKRLGEVE